MSKKNGISTPEGYFGDLQSRLSEIPRREVPVRGIRRLAPYVAYAASLLVAVMLGNLVLRKTAAEPAEDDGWTYVSYLAESLDPDGESLLDAVAWETGDGLSEEDIINYLLADGVTVEHLNYVNYEEDY